MKIRYQLMVGGAIAVASLGGCKSDCERLCEDDGLQADLANLGVPVDCSDDAFKEANSCSECQDVFLEDLGFEDAGVSLGALSPGASICDQYF